MKYAIKADNKNAMTQLIFIGVHMQFDLQPEYIRKQYELISNKAIGILKQKQ